MKNTFTFLETIKTTDGHTIVFKGDALGKFFKKTYEENHANLSEEQKHEAFLVEQEYGDILLRMYKEPLQKLLGDVGWIVPNDERNPIEEYEYALSLPKDEDMTEEEHNLKIERLRLHKEWYEKQIS